MVDTIVKIANAVDDNTAAQVLQMNGFLTLLLQGSLGKRSNVINVALPCLRHLLSESQAADADRLKVLASFRLDSRQLTFMW